MIALSVAVMTVGAMLDVLDLTVSMFASLLVMLAYLEMGSPYTWCIWLGTSLAAAILFPGSIIWAEYLLIFGIYPIIKGFVERLPRRAWFIVKLVFINAVIWILLLVVDGILGIGFVDADTPIMKIVLYVLMNIAFIAYDKFIEIFARLYIVKFKDRFKKFFN